MFLRATLLAAALALPAFAQDDPLPSWNDGATKQAIVDFVAAATTEGGPDYIAPADRIATFDNDGTLWSEQPMYVQGMFVNDRIKAMAADHPEWASEMPYKAVLDGDMAALGAAGEEGLVKLLAVTHAGMTSEEFEGQVRDDPDAAAETSDSLSADDLDDLTAPIAAMLVQTDDILDAIQRMRARGGGRQPGLERPSADRGLARSRQDPRGQGDADAVLADLVKLVAPA